MKSKSTYLVLLLLYTPLCVAVSTQFNSIFQIDPGSEKVLLQNNIFERDIYNGIGVQDESGMPLNQLLAEYAVSYQGEVGTCPHKWSNGKCEYITRWWVWWQFPCASEGRYRLKVLYNGSTIGEDDFSPTRFTPVIEDILVSDSIQPKLLGDEFASKEMPTIEAEGTYVFSIVMGEAGNQKQCRILLPDTTVKLTNTITPGSGGHAHFSNANELGTGVYSPLNASDILDPDTPETRNTVIEGKSLSNGVFYAFYTAGELGVNETITVEARRDATDTDPDERKSEVVTKTLDIKAPNLVEMPQGSADGQFYFSYGGTCVHNPTARWVVPGMKSRLVLLDAFYKYKFGHRLSFNDGSVKFGGAFDNKDNGGRESLCHQSHRRGNDIDVNTVDENSVNVRNELYIYEYVVDGVTKAKSIKRIDYIDQLSNQLGLERVVEKNSIHYRYINY